MLTAEVEQILGVGERTLQRLLRTRPELRPAKRVGGAYVWTAAEVDRARRARARKAKKAEAEE